MSEHNHPKKPESMPEVSDDEIKALQSGVLGTFSGVSIVRNEPKPVTINRAMRRKGAK